MADTATAPKKRQQMREAFPPSATVELLGGVSIKLEPPTFETLGKLEEAFDSDWEECLSRVDVRQRADYLKLVTLLAQQSDPDITTETLAKSIDIQKMWEVVSGVQDVIVKSQPSTELLKKLAGQGIQPEGMPLTSETSSTTSEKLDSPSPQSEN